MLIAIFSILTACSVDKDTQPIDKREALLPTLENPAPPTQVTPTTDKQHPNLPRPILDLSIPLQELEGDAATPIAELELLPDFFIVKKEKRINLRGGLLRKDTDDGFIDSIQGAEVSIETKVK